MVCEVISMIKLVLFIAVLTSQHVKEGEKSYSFLETRSFVNVETCEAYGKFRVEEEKYKRHMYFHCRPFQPAEAEKWNGPDE